jgi:hypothetical protein
MNIIVVLVLLAITFGAGYARGRSAEHRRLSDAATAIGDLTRKPGQR